MKILILGLNYAPETIGIAVYTTGMAEALVAAGHHVHVLAGKPYYPAWKIAAGHNPFTFARTLENAVDVTRIPHYVPARPSGIRRLLHQLSFVALATLPTLWRAAIWRPDVVIGIAPSLMAAPLAKVAATLAGCPSWLHVHDFEAEAAFATGLLDATSWMGRLAARFERAVIGLFDKVSTISPQMCLKLEMKGVPRHRIFEFRNWADVQSIRPLKAPSTHRQEWDITTPHVALYSGSIANKQGIDILIDAAHLLAHRADLTIVVCGEGPNLVNLKAKAKGLTNMRFFGLQPKARLGDLFGLASIHLLPQIGAAADLVLPSKLANMLASGRPVVATASPGTGLYAAIDGCGLLVPPGDAGSLAIAIETLADDAQLSAELGCAGRTRAETDWAEDAILARWIANLEDFAARAEIQADQRRFDEQQSP